MLSTLAITIIPSPYQVELFNLLAAQPEHRFRVVYLQRMTVDRQWKVLPLEHDHSFLEEVADPLPHLRAQAQGRDLVVFSNFSHPAVRGFMAECQREGRAWCYWGERPGFRSSGLLGRLFRRLRLAPLHQSRVPIWGMGSWAIPVWQREFGSRRPYFNVPYFSNLDRFRPPSASATGRRRFLMSGSLSHRKGVDVLVEAFLRLLAEHPEAELHLLGSGEWEAKLRKRCAGVTNVRFLGFRDWPDLPAAYHAADFLVVPSRYDGWNLTVPEGLAAGLPVLVSDRTGAGFDLVQPGSNGWRFEAGKVEPLLGALRSAASLTDEQVTEMRHAALATAAEHSLANGAARWLQAARESLKSLSTSRAA